VHFDPHGFLKDHISAPITGAVSLNFYMCWTVSKTGSMHRAYKKKTQSLILPWVTK